MRKLSLCPLQAPSTVPTGRTPAPGASLFPNYRRGKFFGKLSPLPRMALN
jgi:hypothetical protein